MLNHITIAGRLVADPELKQTPGGVDVATARIACDRDFKNKDTGERETDFVPIVAWRQTATFLSQHFIKGQSVIVDGRLQIRNYNDRDGNKRTIAEVVAEHIYFCGESPRHTETAPAAYSGAVSDAFEELDDADGELPF